MSRQELPHWGLPVPKTQPTCIYFGQYLQTFIISYSFIHPLFTVLILQLAQKRGQQLTQYLVHYNRLYGFCFRFQIKCKINRTTVSVWDLEYKPKEAWTKPCCLRFSDWLVSASEWEHLVPVEKKGRKSHLLSLWVTYHSHCHLLPSKQYSTT